MEIIIPEKPENEYNNYYSISNEYYNIYRKEKDNAADDYIWFNSAEINLYSKTNSIEIKGTLYNNQLQSRFSYNDKFLKTLQFSYYKTGFKFDITKHFDRLSLYQYTYFQKYPGIGFGAGLELGKTLLFYKSNFKGELFDISYLTENQEENIPLPFYFYSNELSVRYKDTHLNSSLIIPVNNIHTDPFRIKLYGQYYSFDFTSKFLDAYFSQINMDGELFYNNSNYGSLDNFNLIQTYFLLKKDLFKMDFRTGITFLKFNIGEGTYIDSVPFDQSAGLYPLRFILDKAELNITAPNISVNKYFKSRNSNLNLSLFYYYILQNNKFSYKEREYTVFPLLYKYNEHEDSYSLNIDSLIKLNLSEVFFIKKLRISLCFTQLIPFKMVSLFSKHNSTEIQESTTTNTTNEGSPPSEESSSKEKIWGGTFFTIEASLPF